MKSRSIIPPPLFPPRAGFLRVDAFLFGAAFIAGVALATGFRLGGIEWYQKTRKKCSNDVQ